MNGEERTIAVFVVAASAITRVGLESMLGEKGDFEIAGSAAEISAAPFAFASNQTADVILVNIEREADFDDLQEIVNDDAGENIQPSVVIIIPSELLDSEYAVRALQNGARGILPHTASANEIVASIAAAANNLVSLSPEIIENLLAAIDSPISTFANQQEKTIDEPIEHLTARELEILEMLTGGASNKAIAFQLNISEHTVKFHVASIFGKFGVNTRTEAVTQALRRGLILL